MKENIKKAMMWLLDLIINAFIIVGLVLIIQNWIIAPFDVFGSSMCDTLNFIDEECKNEKGEKIMINAAGYIFGNPERGDIIVFRAPEEEKKFFIKRVIGLPGDTVKIEKGLVFVNGLELDESYLNKENKGNTKTYFSNASQYNVPQNKYFLMGDNRKASTDSRTCFQHAISIDCKKQPEHSFIDKEAIVGKAMLVWWPLDNMRIIEKTDYNQAKSESIEEK